MERRERLRKCKRDNSWIWRKNEYRSEEIREARYDRGKKL